MVFIAVAAVAVLLVIVGAGVWIFGPTLRSLRHPGFEPTASDDEAVLRAQTSYIDTAGGAGGTGL